MRGDRTTARQIQHTGRVTICQNYPPPATLILDVFQTYFLLFFLNFPVLFFTEYQHIDQVAVVTALSHYTRLSRDL